MTKRSLLLLAVLLPFLAYTAWAFADVGLVGAFEAALGTPVGVQVGLDLLIALGLFVFWMWQDASARGRNPLGWTLLVCGTGSIGALVYLIARERQAASPSVTSASASRRASAMSL